MSIITAGVYAEPLPIHFVHVMFPFKHSYKYAFVHISIVLGIFLGHGIHRVKITVDKCETDAIRHRIGFE